LIIPAGGLAETGDSQKVVLQLRWNHQFQFAGYYAAIEKGYYREAGLQVNLIEAVEGRNPSEAVFEGKAEFGVCTSDILLMRAQKKDAVVLATIFQHSPQILLAARQSGINHVQDLAGKRIAVEPNAADIVAYMNDEGVGPDKCIIKPHSFNTDKLINGEIDAITAYSTDEPYLLEKANFEYVIISPAMGGIDFYGDVLFTTEAFIKQNPALVNDFREASLKGWKYAMDHPEEIIELVYNKYSKRHSKEHLRFESTHMQNLIMADVVEPGYSNSGRWESIADIYKKSKMLDASFSTKGLLYSEYLEPSITIPWKLIVILLAIILITGSATYFFYNTARTLKNEIRNRLRVENELLESEERFKKLFLEAPMGIARIDSLTGQIFDVNPMFAKIVGRTVAEMCHIDWMSITHPDDVQRDLDSMALLNAGKIAGFHMEKRYLYPDSTIVWVNMTIASIHVEDKTHPRHLAIIEDITERKKLEAVLKKNREEFMELFDNAPIGYHELNTEGRIARINQTELNMLGYSSDELLGQYLWKLNADEETAFQAITAKLSGTLTSSQPFERELRRKDGTTVYVLVKDSILKDKDGCITGIRSTVQDITDRKLAEEALRASDEKFRVLFETMPNGFYRSTPEGYFVDANPAFVKMLGYDSKEELLKVYIPTDLYVQAAERDVFARENIDFISNLEVYRLKTKDGRIIWIEENARYIKDENGRVIFNEGICRDITDRKQAQEKLLESEKRYRLLIETANEGILVVQGSRLKFVNPMMLAITGYTMEELLSLPLLYFIHPDDSELIISNQQKRLKDEPVKRRYHLRLIKKDQSITWAEISGVRIEWEGQPATLNFVNDITERKASELEIKLKNEELSKLLAEKDKFFSIIAHDLRGPFGSFMSITEIIAEKLPSMTMDEIQKLMVNMSKSATNLYGLLENLLEWAGMQRGITRFEPASFLLMPKMAECLQSILDLANKKGIAIDFSVPDDLRVFADGNMLGSTLRNLASNAVKFTPRGGRVNLSARVTADKTVEISIRDTGIGMSREMVDNLFRIDVQTNRKGTDDEPSSGLGLLLCKEFVEKHGGKIRVESEEGKGSTFYFTIPENGGLSEGVL